MQPTRELGRTTLNRSRSQCCTSTSWLCSGWGLPSQSGRPDCWWSLTPPFHPYHPLMGGGLLSVALSRGSLRMGVTHHLALRSPDFPRHLDDAAAARPTRSSPEYAYMPESRCAHQLGRAYEETPRTSRQPHSSQFSSSSSGLLSRSAAVPGGNDKRQPRHWPFCNTAAATPVAFRELR